MGWISSKGVAIVKKFSKKVFLIILKEDYPIATTSGTTALEIRPLKNILGIREKDDEVNFTKLLVCC